MRNDNNNNETAKKQSSPAVDGEGLDLVKAAAWAWYERANAKGSTAVREHTRHFFTRKPSPFVYRASRFRAEASADRKRGGSREYVTQNNNKSKRHSFDNSRLSRSAYTDFAADGWSRREEDEYLKGSVRNLADKYPERWDFGKSLFDSYEIVAISKHVENYAPFNVSLWSRAGQEAAAAADTNRTTNANADGTAADFCLLPSAADTNRNIRVNANSTVADLCLLPSDDGSLMCSLPSEMAGDLEIGISQKPRYLQSLFSLNAFSKKLKSLAHLQFVRLQHRGCKQIQHRRGHHRPSYIRDLKH